MAEITDITLTNAVPTGPSGSNTVKTLSAFVGTKAAGTAAGYSALMGGVFNTTPPTVGNGQQAALQLSAAGRVLVDAAVTGTFYQATQPVSGTFWQATQPVSGTFWQATQPVSAASLPLPTGAATAANQATIIGHVDGIEASLTAIDGHVDGLETLITSSNTKLDTLNTTITSGVSTAIPAGTAMIGHVGGTEYELVAASQTTQSIGATGAVGDYLSHVLVIPETVSAGTVAIKDGSGTAINIFVSGTLSNLVPFVVPVGAKSASGAWQVTTGAAVHCIAFGDFT